MTAATNAAVAFAYATGEEVVVRLAGVAVHGIEAGRPLAAACVPAWAIAEIADAFTRDGAPHYALRFAIYDAPCLAIADESAIEGVA